MKNLKESVFNDNDIVKDAEKAIKYGKRITRVEVINSRFENSLGTGKLLSNVWNKKNYDTWKKEFGFDMGQFNPRLDKSDDIAKALFGCLSSPEQIEYVLNRWRFMLAEWKYSGDKGNNAVYKYNFKGTDIYNGKIDVYVWILKK